MGRGRGGLLAGGLGLALTGALGLGLGADLTGADLVAGGGADLTAAVWGGLDLVPAGWGWDWGRLDSG